MCVPSPRVEIIAIRSPVILYSEVFFPIPIPVFVLPNVSGQTCGPYAIEFMGSLNRIYVSAPMHSSSPCVKGLVRETGEGVEGRAREVNAWRRGVERAGTFCRRSVLNFRISARVNARCRWQTRKTTGGIPLGRHLP